MTQLEIVSTAKNINEAYVIVEGNRVEVKPLPKLKLEYKETDKEGNDIYSFDFFGDVLQSSPLREPFTLQKLEISDLIGSYSDVEEEQTELTDVHHAFTDVDDKQESDKDVREINKRAAKFDWDSAAPNFNTLGAMLRNKEVILEGIDKMDNHHEEQTSDDKSRIHVYRYAERMKDYSELNALGVHAFYVPTQMFRKEMSREKINSYWSRFLRVEKAFIVFKTPQEHKRAFGELDALVGENNKE